MKKKTDTQITVQDTYANQANKAFNKPQGYCKKVYYHVHINSYTRHIVLFVFLCTSAWNKKEGFGGEEEQLQMGY